MAGACSCESCFGKAAEACEALSGACSCESCLGGLWEAARVALERPAGGFEGFEVGQTVVARKGLKHCLGRVAARVALERPAGRFGRGSCRGAFEALEAWQTANTDKQLLLECEGHGRDKAGSTPPVVQAPPLPWPRQGSAD